MGNDAQPSFRAWTRSARFVAGAHSAVSDWMEEIVDAQLLVPPCLLSPSCTLTLAVTHLPPSAGNAILLPLKDGSANTTGRQGVMAPVATETRRFPPTKAPPHVRQINDSVFEDFYCASGEPALGEVVTSREAVGQQLRSGGSRRCRCQWKV
ncbi:hypothetical protein PMIN06_012534 [Paraphaeosphaeria minitans]|uniref:Uncharacterized protein n=1 Tax=Paraphaeosphaeria minitans TaxID=565426 RepID=A0A9P6G3D3_9PLEO|nr:hypothetical protein PMIN01_13672 [Paraphaeosphaeria minitans]KAF9728678.1 hypothetical protein PMIN01_13506 [Paraphaeosphaeria minitans]